MGEIVLYKSAGKSTHIEVRIKGESISLTRKQMGDLFGIGSAAITKHINNIYNSKELSQTATTSKMEVVQ